MLQLNYKGKKEFCSYVKNSLLYYGVLNHSFVPFINFGENIHPAPLLFIRDCAIIKFLTLWAGMQRCQLCFILNITTKVEFNNTNFRPHYFHYSKMPVFSLCKVSYCYTITAQYMAFIDISKIYIGKYSILCSCLCICSLAQVHKLSM